MLSLGRQGRAFTGLHSVYGDSPTPSAADAIRHIMFLENSDPTNRRNSPEKRFTPFHFNRFDGREIAGLRQFTALMRPSGTLNTLPEASDILEAIFGSKTNVTLATVCTPKAPTVALVTTSAGDIDAGSHAYKVAFVSAAGTSLPSAASNAVTNDGTHDQNTVTIPVGPTGTTARKIYRNTVAAQAVFTLAGTVANNTATTYTDSADDATVGGGAAVEGADASGLLTTTTGFIADPGLLAADDHVLFTCADGIKRARRLTSVGTGGAIAWSPALSAAPAAAAAVKGGVTYKVTTGNALVFWIAHYLKKTDGSTAGLKRLLKCIHGDKFSLSLDGTDEAQFTVSGAAQELLTAGDVPAQPGAFTEVGGNPPPGWQTELWIGSTLQKFLKGQLEFTNALRQRNNEAGAGASNKATESYRAGAPGVSIGFDARLEDEAVIYDPAHAGTDLGFFLQNGFTEGNIWTLGLPRVEFKVPDLGDEDEEVSAPYKGMALASADGVNDAIFMAIL